MSKQFRDSYTKLPKSQHDAEEFGKGKKGLIICKKCSNAYFKKSWHHDLEGIKNFEKDTPIHFTICPACQMIADHQYEGRIVITSVPEKMADDLDHMIRNFCHRAFERDPLDRLIELKKENSEWIVTATENELANKLANKVKDAFNKVKITRKFGKEPSDVVEITIEFES